MVDALDSFVAGAISGLAARLVTFPADTLKAQLQVKGALGAKNAVQFKTTAGAARHILATDGFTGLYRGFGAILWGLVPANLAYFQGDFGRSP